MINEIEIGCCEICFCPFDRNTKMPTKLTCSHFFCLECIKLTYNKQNTIVCPSCRAQSNIKPENLQPHLAIFDTFFPCPKCNNEITKNDLYIEEGVIKCSQCIESKDNGFILNDCLQLLINDKRDLKKYADISETDLSRRIDNMINEALDSFYNAVISNVKTRIKQIYIDNIKKEFNSYDIFVKEKEFYKTIIDLKKTYETIDKYMSEVKLETISLNDLLKSIEIGQNNMLDNTFDKVNQYIDFNSVKISPFIHRKEFEDLLLYCIEEPVIIKTESNYKLNNKSILTSFDDLIKSYLNMPKVNHEIFNYISLSSFSKESLIPFDLQLKSNAVIDIENNVQLIKENYSLFDESNIEKSNDIVRNVFNRDNNDCLILDLNNSDKDPSIKNNPKPSFLEEFNSNRKYVKDKVIQPHEIHSRK